MSEWKETNLGNVISTNTESIGRDYPYSEILYLDTGSITCNKIDSLQFYKLDKAPSRAKRLVKNQDIIYSSVRPNQLHYGFITNAQNNLVVSTGFVVISSDNERVEPRFLYYFLSQNSTTEYLHSIAEASTSTYPSLKPSDIEALDILLPSLPEQKSIAAVLSSLDDKIDLLHRQNATLEALAETLFRQLFVEEAKEEWDYDELKKLVGVVDNRGKTPPNNEVQTNYPLIEANALNDEGRLVNYSVIKKYVTEEIFNNWFRNQLKKYDTIITTVGANIGAMAMFVIDRGNIAQNIIGLSANGLSAFYLYQMLKYKADEILQMDIGGVQPSLKVPHLLSIEIPIPPIELQNRFDTLVLNFVSKMENNYTQIRTLTTLRDTLLPKLMSGELRVKMN